MSKPSNAFQPLAVQPVYLAASAINRVIHAWPAGTAYGRGVVLITMFTGQLVHHQGSLARAALPYVLQLRWGWHRVERAMERGKVSLDALFERALIWCFAGLPVEPVRVGRERRTVHAIDSSTVVRLRANKKRCALLGKGYIPMDEAVRQVSEGSAARMAEFNAADPLTKAEGVAFSDGINTYIS